MEIDDGNNQATEEQEEFQRLDRQLEEEAIFPQENEQPTDADVPMDTRLILFLKVLTFQTEKLLQKMDLNWRHWLEPMMNIT